jgi:hypothetical protein
VPRRWDRPYRAGRSSAKEKLIDICDRADGRHRPKEGVARIMAGLVYRRFFALALS